MWIDARPGGLIGAVRTMKRLRAECPWDREQTHASLTKYLVEEAFELIEAIGGLGDGDLVAAARVEEEVGDVLLQVLFQAAIASEEGLFDIDDAAEVLRQKLERRHPHVFGDVEVADAAEVKSNWDAIKVEEKGGHPESIFDGVPQGMPALHRASKVQNRAAKAGHEMPDSRARLVDSIAALTRADEVAADSLGQALFDLVDLGRHFGIDSEMALRSAIERFQQESGADAAAGPGEQHIEKTGDSP